MASRARARSRVTPRMGMKTSAIPRHAGIGHDEASTPVHRKVGQADCEIPPLLRLPVAADIEDLRCLPLGAGERIYDDGDSPGDPLA